MSAGETALRKRTMLRTAMGAAIAEASQAPGAAASATFSGAGRPDTGSSSDTVVPFPSALSSRTPPPLCRAKP